MSQDDQLASLVATVEALQLRLGAIEAIVTEDPESRQKFEAFLRTAEKRALLDQQTHSYPGILFQTKKPN